MSLEDKGFVYDFTEILLKVAKSWQLFLFQATRREEWKDESHLLGNASVVRHRGRV